MKFKYFNVVFCVMIFLAILLLTESNIQAMKHFLGYQNKEDAKKINVVIDPGHGGRDPGKVGINNVLEKDINLAIAFELKELLELNDINVIMTRESDIGLYSETDSNKKAADLKKRIEIINQNDIDLAVSIHQNSYSDESIYGAQVFYYKGSEEGKKLAGIVQAQIEQTIVDDKKRLEKSNDNYYMLKKSNCPLVIIECGFLSNSKEAGLLVTEDYQRSMAWAIHLGVINYLNSLK